ncbi:hypothetical protein DMENIID0001_014180 [Sergentomyia squamirostris]
MDLSKISWSNRLDSILDHLSTEERSTRNVVDHGIQFAPDPPDDSSNKSNKDVPKNLKDSGGLKESKAKGAGNTESPVASSRCEEKPSARGDLWTSYSEEEESKEHLNLIMTSIKHWVRCEVKYKEVRNLHEHMLLDDKKNRDHKEHMDKMTRSHESEVEKLHMRLDKLRTNAVDAKHLATIKSLEEVLQKKESEMKMLQENHEQEVREMRKSHEKEVSKLNNNINRLEKEKKDRQTREMKQQNRTDETKTETGGGARPQNTDTRQKKKKWTPRGPRVQK